MIAGGLDRAGVYVLWVADDGVTVSGTGAIVAGLSDEPRGTPLPPSATKRRLDGATERRGTLFGARPADQDDGSMSAAAACMLDSPDMTTTPND